MRPLGLLGAVAMLAACVGAAAGAATADVWRSQAPPDSLADLERRVQAVLDDKAVLWNTSFSFALRTAGGLARVAAGVSDHTSGARATTQTLVPMGSVTKPFTAAGVLRLVEAGRFGLDDRAAPLADRALTEWNGTTLAGMFPPEARPAVERITIRQLLGMTAGLNDLDDTAAQVWTFTHPDGDISPLDYLHHFNKTMLCEPGQCCAYSSVNYIILGFILAFESGAASWDAFDQLSALPAALQAELRSLGIEFPLRGKCSEHPNVSHQYAAWHVDGEQALHFFDIDSYSCLNGWTCGNIAPSPAAVATYFYELFNGRVVSKQTLAEMQRWHPFTTGYSVGSLYGLGLFFENYFPIKSGVVVNETATIGHGGMDWGSGASPVGYNVKWDFGIAFAVGAVAGINCSLPNALTNANAWQDALCPVYDLVLQHVSAGAAPSLDCTWQAAQAWDYGWTSNKTVVCNYTLPAFTAEGSGDRVAALAGGGRGRRSPLS